MLPCTSQYTKHCTYDIKYGSNYHIYVVPTDISASTIGNVQCTMQKLKLFYWCLLLFFI